MNPIVRAGRLARGVPAIVLLEVAHGQAARRHISRALRTVALALRLYGKPFPTEKSPLPANLLFSRLCTEAGRVEAAFNGCRTVLFQIDQHRKPDGADARAADFDYAAFLCRWILASMAEQSPEALALARSVKIRADQIRLEAVSRLLLRWLPWDEQSARSVDEYMMMMQFWPTPNPWNATWTWKG